MTATTLMTSPQTASPERRNALDVLKERGLFYQCSDEEGLRLALAEKHLTFYAGFDPTADSLHVGHLVQVMAMANLQRAGHRAIALVGGGTAVIGDPTDRTSARPMLSREEIAENAAAIGRQLGRYLQSVGGAWQMADNADWLLGLNYLQFMRDYGVYFSVNEMLRADTYRTRLETGLTFFEFNYMLLQAYDFLELYRRAGCTLQIGGSDQWANVLAGADLIRKVERAEAFALTAPLLTDPTGMKMGKSSAGAKVWLDPAKTSPYDFYQYWVNVDDAEVRPFLGIFTFMPVEEIGQLTSAEGAALRPAKERLAFEATALAHGREAAEQAQASARALFGGASLKDLAEAEAIPTSSLPNARLEQGISAVDLLVESGLAESKGAARRLIEQGGAYINGDERLTSRMVTMADVRDGMILLRAGKKRYQRVVPE